MQIRGIRLSVAALLLSTGVSAQTPWERYLSRPTPEGAKQVLSASYRDSSSADPDRLFNDLELLAVQVAAGDREAVRLAFRLYSEADGAYAETLDILLGRIVRIHPTLFLEELQRQRAQVRPRAPRTFDGVVSGILGNLGKEYVDRTRAQVYETERRIASLQSVSNPGLRQSRDHCVAILKYQLDEFRSHSP
jgi:hypothetical protein